MYSSVVSLLYYENLYKLDFYFRSHFFRDALCLKRLSFICSFHFTKRSYRLQFYLLFVALSLSPKVPLLFHVMQISGRFRPNFSLLISELITIAEKV